MVVAVRNGECSFAVTDLATFYGRDTTGGAGAAPYALLGCLWQACRGGVADHRADPQCPRQAASCAALGAGGAGVALSRQIANAPTSVNQATSPEAENSEASSSVGTSAIERSMACLMHR